MTTIRIYRPVIENRCYGYLYLKLSATTTIQSSTGFVTAAISWPDSYDFQYAIASNAARSDLLFQKTLTAGSYLIVFPQMPPTETASDFCISNIYNVTAFNANIRDGNHYEGIDIMQNDLTCLSMVSDLELRYSIRELKDFNCAAFSAFQCTEGLFVGGPESEDDMHLSLLKFASSAQYYRLVAIRIAKAVCGVAF